MAALTSVILGSGFLFALGLGLSPAAAAPTELFFSEYVEGSSNNKALEIFNGTGAAINLAAGNYDLQFFFNGSLTAGATIALTGVVTAGDVYVLAHSSADPALLAQADQTSGGSFFNGDDAISLRKNGTIIDVIGQLGFDPGAAWGSDPTSTQDNTLRRKFSIDSGDPDGSDPFDPALEWNGFAVDTFDGLGVHTTTPPPLTIVINEVAWGGTAAGANDEWLELYNPGPDSIDLANWTLAGNADGQALNITLSGVITAGGYFLL
jgi:predicted extracellular nuclease